MNGSWGKVVRLEGRESARRKPGDEVVRRRKFTAILSMQGCRGTSLLSSGEIFLSRTEM
jgi:hypothetical protein